jgi:beta-lactamase class A
MQSRKIIIPLVSCSIGIMVGVFLLQTPNQAPHGSDDCPNNLNFIKPEQDCVAYNDAAQKMQIMRDALRRQVNGYLDTKRADRISVFVRDLNSQRFAYVNETEEFYMASLLKVPLAIAYYRLAELTPDLLTQQVTYDGKINLYDLQEIKPTQRLTVGTTYTIRDLIYRALAYSDNTAAELLSQNYVSYDYLQKILFTLGLQPRTKDQKENIVTPRLYGGIFRTLYNASFLSREYSNEILKALSESTFTQGATLGLPKDVSISHKFGERSIVDETTKTVTSRQLHDCGVAYAQNGAKPYSYCIMTEGKNFSDLESIIQNISLTIYKGIGE